MNIHNSKIIFDCDGVLLDFVTAFNGYANINGEKYSDNPPAYDFAWCDNPDKIKLLLGEYLNEKVFAPIIDTNIPIFMEYLVNNKNTIYIVTNYPFESSRIKNLISVGIFQGRHYHTIHCCRSEKEKFNKIKEISPDYYFEDCPKFINKVCDNAALTHTQILVPTYYQYTADVSDITRILKYKTFSEDKIVL